MTSRPRILLVDDDDHLRASLTRRYRSRYDIQGVADGRAGLDALRRGPLPEVVVSDYQMPGIDGVTFLRAVQQEFEDTVRIMLTGQADLDVAMGAVNEGSIYRFLTKPCSSDALTTAIDAGLELHRLRRAERMLLERTLTGSIALLSDVLELTNPVAFGRGSRLREIVRRIGLLVPLPNAWVCETAAMLSQIGAVTFPEDLIVRAEAGRQLSAEESAVLADAPEVASRLLERVPRLEAVARVIRRANDASPRLSDDEEFSAQVLRFATLLDTLGSMRRSPSEIVAQAVKECPQAPPEVVRIAPRVLRDRSPRSGSRMVRVNAIPVGAVVAEPVVARDGTKLLGRGQVLTQSALARLQSYVSLGKLDDGVRIAAGEVADDQTEEAA